MLLWIPAKGCGNDMFEEGGFPPSIRSMPACENDMFEEGWVSEETATRTYYMRSQ